jgi:signal transduction histidine kinase
MEFISQLAEHVLPALENVELLDRLATEAAGRQREKISRDIHDSTIQPYIGLKLGLEALVIKCASGRQINEDVAKLIRLADSSIAELRGYVGKLKGESGEESGKVLISAVKQQALKFQEFYNVEVNVEAADGFYMNDRLAAEAFQIVSEGLSNIRRHTKSKRATIGIRREAELLVLEIKNDNDGTVRAGEFLPKSIASRAESLGGRAHIETLESHTRVLVKIPL